MFQVVPHFASTPAAGHLLPLRTRTRTLSPTLTTALQDRLDANVLVPRAVAPPLVRAAGQDVGDAESPAARAARWCAVQLPDARTRHIRA